MNVMNLLPAEESSLDSISAMLDIRLLLHLLLTGTFMHCSWSFALRLFRAYQTQVLYEIPDCFNP